MLIDEKVNSNQKTQESNSKIQKTESSKSVDSSRMSQDSKPKVQNTGSSKSLRPKPIQKPQLKCELCSALSVCIFFQTDLESKGKAFSIMHTLWTQSCHSDQRSSTSWILSVLRRHTRDPIWYLDSGCSRSMTGVKSYLHKYVKQPGPKVVFGDNSSCITEGYGSINYGGVVFIKVAFVNGLKYNLISISQLCDAKYIVHFNENQGTIFNDNKEIVMIAPRRNDVYVLDMSSLTPNGARFFAKASESVNWLWHKRLSHLNFKNINKLAKQNKVLGLPS
ncbi:retrovirus-related pol polyprotein from transposon TNT 1-94 [Tanacetum coccineum]|uniref:Retrovirus-related pol polyprotein from transposon TNT 1-94 n=1 Tax=Tanacetum coccineum TaxID=301880 RepID=A0ABQ5JDL9_9ASTR